MILSWGRRQADRNCAPRLVHAAHAEDGIQQRHQPCPVALLSLGLVTQLAGCIAPPAYQKRLECFSCRKWQPPISNQCLRIFQGAPTWNEPSALVTVTLSVCVSPCLSERTKSYVPSLASGAAVPATTRPPPEPYFDRRPSLLRERRLITR